MEKLTRKPNRLKNYDYSQNGAYFITICSKDRHHLFGEIVTPQENEQTPVGDGLARPAPVYTQLSDYGNVVVGDGLAHPAYTQLSDYGNIVEIELKKIASHYTNVQIDKYVIMPNHVHMIIVVDGVKTGWASPSPTLGNIVGGFKSGVSKRIGFSPWQRSFHDHIIRSQEDYAKIWQYIDENPIRWEEDCFYDK